MPVYDGIDGVIRNRIEWPVGIDGAVRQQKDHFVGIDGANRLIFHSLGVMKLSDVPVGQIVKLRENGAPQDYLVVHHGLPSDLYDESCNGTWLWRVSVHGLSYWNENMINRYLNSSIARKLDSLIEIYDAEIQSKIKTVKIPYCVGGTSKVVKSGADGRECKIFPLSYTELGMNGTSLIPKTGEKLDYFDSLNTTEAKEKRKKEQIYWSRDPYTDTSDTRFAWYVNKAGACGGSNFTASGSSTIWYAQALIMEDSARVDENGNIVA